MSTYDPSYSRRYAKRNAKKAEAIVPHIRNGSVVLDLGCSSGYLCKEILKKNPDCVCYGVELSSKPVDKDLLKDDRFTLWVSSVQDFPFLLDPDYTIYNSVHHHVVGASGWAVASRILDSIAQITKKAVVFETGMVSENGSYVWKKAIKQKFSTDDAHLSAVFEVLGHYGFLDYEILARLPIHGIEREVIKFTHEL